MHELPVGGNFPGMLFAVGSTLIFLLAIPALWYLVAGAAAVGFVIAAALHIVHGMHPNEVSDLRLKL